MEGTEYITKEAVLKRAQEVIGIPLKDIDKTGRLSTGKGAIGTVIEESWYGYSPNGESEPDFSEAGVELKVTPYIKGKKGDIRAKERLVCNIINYMEEYDKTFKTSAFWHKCETMLLMSYEHLKDVPKGEYKIDKAVLFSFPEEDLCIIENDWKIIIDKIRNGQAHLISEGDTMYLAACTKGATAASVRKQPFSDIPAKQRAYSLKSSYMTQVLNTYIFGNSVNERVIKDWHDLKKNTFEDIIVDKPVQNGEDIQLTIDAELQKVLYEQFKDDKSCSVAMNQYTGEVLALVSTPSFNSNDFVMGMSDKLWKSLNEDERQPLYNRFRQVWCPGSTFKPVTAVIGLDTGILDPVEDYGNEGLSWQKDSSWGDYYVTTLHETEPATLENAMIYSDNIYFAKVALKLGENNLTSFLEKLGFNKEIPFDIKMSISQYSNTEGIKSEIQLADSGYGQGQILINPLHLASIYSAFSNDGNIIEPTLLYNPNYNPNIWMPEVIQKESIHTVLETMKKVISEPTATGYGLHREEYTLAGKTGTAEIKLSKEDATGTELGWMAVFTTDPNIENPILLISMVEDVKNIGGSGYVVQKDKRVLDQYLR